MKRGYSHFEVEILLLRVSESKFRIAINVSSGFPVRSFLSTTYAQAAKKDLPCNPV
jgi:hypothetical protein